jgi:hypothetical protein
MKWPSRPRNDDTPEVEVPGEVLAETPETTVPAAAIDAVTLEAAIKAAVQPLQAVIDALLENARASRAAVEALILERNAARADAAELQ